METLRVATSLNSVTRMLAQPCRLSVRPFTRTNSAPTGRICVLFFIGGLSLPSTEKIQIGLKSDKSISHFTQRPKSVYFELQILSLAINALFYIICILLARYGLDGTGIESRWGRAFPQPPRSALGPTQPLLYNGYRVFPGGKEWPGRGVDHSLPSSAEV